MVIKHAKGYIAYIVATSRAFPSFPRARSLENPKAGCAKINMQHTESLIE